MAHLAFPPRLRLLPHVHDRTTLAVVVGGGFEGWWNGREATCSPGSVVVEPAGERHANDFDRVAGARVVIVQPETELSALTSAATRGAADRPDAVPLAWHIRRELHRPDDLSDLALQGLALELVALTARSPVPAELPRPVLARAIEILEVHHAQPLTLSGLARELDVHPGYLARVFRTRFRRSVGAYLREVRIRRAAERLARGEGIADVATAVGFADQSHLTRWFRRYLGVTPGEYRRRLRSGEVRDG